MGPVEAATVLLAGVAAGMVNTVVGSGTLITFPTLLACGLPSVSANVSNCVGLVFGSLTGTWGYRAELGGQRPVLVRLAPVSLLGAVAGALLLLWLPEAAFATIIPVLIGIALVLVLAQAPISRAAGARRERSGRPARTVGPGAMTGVMLSSVYGGYFGAAQGVLLIGMLGALLDEPLQRVNALKNLLAAIVNGVAAVTFIVVRPDSVSWIAVTMIAAGSVLGGLTGAGIGRRLPPAWLRAVVVVVGTVAIVRLVTT